MDVLEHSIHSETLTRQIAEMINAGQVGVARPLLAALRQMTPPSAQSRELSARLAMRENRPEEARDELDQAIAIEPEHTGLRKVRAQFGPNSAISSARRRTRLKRWCLTPQTRRRRRYSAW